MAEFLDIGLFHDNIGFLIFFPYDVILAKPVRFVGLVVMTLASHARGPQFNPGTKYSFLSLDSVVSGYHIFPRTFGCPWSDVDTLAEWLRRRPAKPVGSARVGSNPTGVVYSSFSVAMDTQSCYSR